jgi:hypothetical protein
VRYLLQESDELVRILSSIIQSAKQSMINDSMTNDQLFIGIWSLVIGI